MYPMQGNAMSSLVLGDALKHSHIGNVPIIGRNYDFFEYLLTLQFSFSLVSIFAKIY